MTKHRGTETPPMDLEGRGAVIKDWQPRATPPIPDLTPAQELACAFRILAGFGFSENIAGHITVVDEADQTMLVNPWGLWWEEVSASDIVRVAPDGSVVEGRWDVTPAIHIHTELHRAQPKNRVIVHNHPYWSTVLAALGSLPEIFHQTGCLFDQDMVFIDEYRGEIVDANAGERLASAIGAAPVALLANHGVIVAAPNLREAVYRAAVFDRQCRLAYDVLLAHGQIDGAVAQPVAPTVRPGLKRALIERGADVYWAGAVRRIVRLEPEVLT